MKNTLLHLFFLLSTLTIRAQAVAWELSGEPGDQASSSASLLTSNFSNCVLTRGAGVTATTGAGSMNSSAWFSGATPTTLSDAIAGNDYYEFTCNTINCLFFNPTSIKIVLRSSATGPNTATLRCSSDGFTANIGTVNVTTTSTAVTFSETVSPNSESVTYRLYGYGAAAGGGTPSTGGTMRIGTSVVAADNDLEIFASTTFATVAQVSNITVTDGTLVPATVFSANVPGATVNWSRTPENFGLAPTSGTGNVPAFTALNASGAPIISTFTVNATVGNCTGPDMIFTITVNPATCSITSIALSNIICHDNNTPTITSDDYMIFTINPSGVNLGTTYNATATASVLGNTIPLPITQLDGSPATNIPYGSPVQLRTDAGSIASGLSIPFTVTVTDDGDTGCTQTGSGTMPPFCSVPCNLTTIALSNIICHDNNTPTITSDDYMIFTLNPSGVSLGTTYDATATASVLGNTIPLPITQLDGSPATNIPYGSPVQLRTDAGSIASGLSIPFTVTVTDDGDTGCTQTGSGTMPPFCSSPPPACDILSVNYLGNPGACNDNGTPNDPSDDFFTQNIQATFINRPATGSLQIVPGGDQIGTYSIPVNQIIGNSHVFNGVQLKADGTPSVITMNFTDDPGCSLTKSGPSIASCSGSFACEIIGFSFANIAQCNDNGTPGNPADDFFTADVDVLFSNPIGGATNLILNGADVVAAVNAPVPVGQNQTHTFAGVKLRADAQPVDLLAIIFNAAPICSSPGTGPAVGSCSSGGGACSINSIDLQNTSSCNDNGTGDPGDDFFTANVVVNFSNPPATGNLEIEPGGDALGVNAIPVANLSGTSHTFTNVHFKADGTVTAIEVDFTADQGCVRTATDAAVQPCSVPCSVNSISLQNIGSCNNNGTDDPTDDFFTADVLVNFTSPPATGSLEIEPGGDALGVNAIPVANLSGTSHTFTNVHFKADGTVTAIEVDFTADQGCVRTSTAAAVQPCSYLPPVLTCPAAASVSCFSQVPAANPAAVSETHSCPGNVTITNLGDLNSNVNCPNRLTITRTYKATDQCLHTVTCSQTITVNDQTAPTLTCPAAQTVSCVSQVPVANTNLVTGLSDNCGGASPTVAFINDVTSNQTCVNRFTLTRTYRATDFCGNSATCSQVITVNDQTGPAITCPAPQTVSCAEQVPVANPVLVTGSDNCGGGITTSFFTEVISSQTCANRFILTRQYRAADACGNTASCTQLITVNDQTPPTFTFVPANTTVECHLVPAVATVTASDNCTSGATVTFLGEVISNGVCPVAFIHTRTWRATDACGNSATTSQVIFVTDTQAPQFLVLPKNAVRDCGVDNAAEFQAFLDSFGDAVVEDCTEITYSHEDSPIQDNTYNCGNTFRKNIRFIATDRCGNSSFRDARFTVADLTPPVFSTPPQSVELECDASDDNGESTFYDWLDSNAGLVVEDACGVVTSLEKVMISEYHGCGKTWKKTYEFRAKDACDNLSKITATFAVVDNTPPTLVCPPNDNVYLPCLEDVPAPVPSALVAWDCSGSVVTLQDKWTSGTACPNWPMTVAYRYAATDACGNEAVCERAFYVKESNAPELVCPDTIKIACVDDIPGPLQLFAYVKNLLKSNCAGSFWSIQILADSGMPQNGDQYRTYSITAKNHCGLITSSCSVTFLATGNCNDFCTASQASWGDPAGTVGAMNTTDAINQLIQAYGPVTVGGGVRKLSAFDAACIQTMLFGNGNFSSLPTGHFSCPLPIDLANTDGSLNNQLAANAIALQLNIWYNLKFNNRDLGVQSLDNLPPCLVEFALLKDLAQHNTVQDLLDLTNDYLGDIGFYYAPDLPGYLNSALDNLNFFRADCELNAPCEKPVIRSESRTSQNRFSRLYPNPASDAAMLEFWSDNSGEISLKIADARGARSERVLTVNKGMNTVEISLKQLPAGVYWVSLQYGGKVETQRLIKVD